MADRLRVHLAGKRRCPIVLDPVMVAKSGDRLLREDAVEALIAELLPLATLVTPNLPELEAPHRPACRHGGGAAAGGRGAAPRAGPAVLAKGGHAEGEEVVDLLLERTAGSTASPIRGSHTRSTHGTGCTLSSAIAARLGAGEDLPQAVEGAIDYLAWRHGGRLPGGLGNGHGPVDHFYLLEGRTA